MGINFEGGNVYRDHYPMNFFRGTKNEFFGIFRRNKKIFNRLF